MTPLLSGAYHRIRVALPPAYERQLRASASPGEGQRVVLEDVERRLEAFGWADVTVTQDPTTPGLFTATALWQGRSGTFRAPFVAEVVETPPAPPSAPPPRMLDQGMTPEEARTLEIVLAIDGNARHLRGFAATCEPSLPCAASLLRIKAELLDSRTRHRRKAREIAERGKHLAMVRALEASGRDGKAWLASSVRSIDAGPVLEGLTRELRPDVAAMWRDLIPSARWLPDVRARAAAEGLRCKDAGTSAAVGPSPLSDLFDATAGRSTAERDADLRVAGAYPGLLAKRRASLEAYAAKEGLPVDLVRDHMRMLACRHAEGHTGAIGPAPIDEAARAAVREIGPDLRIVDPAAIRILCPPSDRDGYVSPGALQLALASMKPRWSRVGSTEEAARLCETLPKADKGDLDAIRANAELEKSIRTIERQRWIEWYRRLLERSPPTNRSSRVAAIR